MLVSCLAVHIFTGRVQDTLTKGSVVAAVLEVCTKSRTHKQHVVHMSTKQSAKNLPSLDEGKSPFDPYSGHIRINRLCNVLTTAAVLKNSVFTNTRHRLMDRNLPREQATVALRNSNVNNVYRAYKFDVVLTVHHR